MNFKFLENEYPLLASLGETAENYLFSDPNACLIKLGMFGETIVSIIIDVNKIKISKEEDTQVYRINILKNIGLLPLQIDRILSELRVSRNRAVHDGYESIDLCKNMLQSAYSLGVWFYKSYVNLNYMPKPFSLPLINDTIKDYSQIISEQEKQISLLFAKMEEFNTRSWEISKKMSTIERVALSNKAADSLVISKSNQVITNNDLAQINQQQKNVTNTNHYNNISSNEIKGKANNKAYTNKNMFVIITSVISIIIISLLILSFDYYDLLEYKHIKISDDYTDFTTSILESTSAETLRESYTSDISSLTEHSESIEPTVLVTEILFVSPTPTITIIPTPFPTRIPTNTPSPSPSAVPTAIPTQLVLPSDYGKDFTIISRGNLIGNQANNGLILYVKETKQIIHSGEYIGKMVISNLDLIPEKVLLNESCNHLNIFNEWVYFVRKSDGYVCRMKIDGTGYEEIVRNSCSNLVIVNDLAFFTKKSGVYCYSLKTQEVLNIISGSVVEMSIIDEWIYFCKESNGLYSIYRMNWNGTNIQLIKPGEHGIISALSIDSDFLYYGYDNRIFRLSVKGGEPEQLVNYSSYNPYISEIGLIYTGLPNYGEGALFLLNLNNLSDDPQRLAGEYGAVACYIEGYIFFYNNELLRVNVDGSNLIHMDYDW